MHNERERRAYEEAERKSRAGSRNDGWFDPDEYAAKKTEDLPTVDEVKAVFSRMLS